MTEGEYRLLQQKAENDLAAEGSMYPPPKEVWNHPVLQEKVGAFAEALLEHKKKDRQFNLASFWRKSGEPTNNLPDLCYECFEDVVMALNGATSELLHEALKLLRESNQRKLDPEWEGGWSAGSIAKHETADINDRRQKPSLLRPNNRPPSREEKACARTQAEFLAWHLRRRTSVREFREAVLERDANGDLIFLGREQAWRLLTSPLWRVLDVKDFKRLGVSPVRATGGLIPPDMRYSSLDRVERHHGPIHRLSEKSADASRWRFHVELNIPQEAGGGVVRQYVDRRSLAYSVIKSAVLNIPFDTHCKPFLHPGEPAATVPRAYGGRAGGSVDGFYVEIDVKDGHSITGHALAVCGNLQAFAMTEIWSLLHFLLTDHLPRCRPIHTSDSLYFAVEGCVPFGAYGPTALFVQPWVRPDALDAFWRTAQGRVRNGSLPSEYHREIFLFVLSETAERDLTWEELSDRWNNRPSAERKYKTVTADTMGKDFRRVRDKLFPHYLEWGEDSTQWSSRL